MAIQIMSILLMLGVAYVWSARGFLSSLLNMAVTLASGAIAFGLMEWSTEVTLGLSDSALLRDLAPALGLLVPFVLSLVVLSVLVNVFVRANARVNVVMDWVGGALCGLVSGVIVAGVFGIGSQMIRMNADALEYRGAEFNNSGSVTRTEGLWIPVDRWTSKMYAMMSNNALATDTPLSIWRPHVAYEGAMRRLGPSEMLLRNSLTEKDFRFIARYTVGSGDKDIPLASLVGDSKPVLSVEGEPVSGRVYTEGYVVQFEASAREKNGQVVMSPGQVTLVAMKPDGITSASYSPVAVISQARGDSKQIGRWRFDAKDVFIGSAGAETKPLFAIEFVIPKDQRPLALYVRGVRVDVVTDVVSFAPVKSAIDFDDLATVERVISRGRFLESVSPSLAGKSAFMRNPKGVGAVPVTPQGGQTAVIQMSNALPGGVFLDASFLTGAKVNDKARVITSGKVQLPVKDLSPAGTEMNLRIDSIDPGEGTAIVLVDVSRTSPLSMVQPENAEFTGQPQLVSVDGQRFPAIGYVYESGGNFTLALDATRPIMSFDEVPSVSRSMDGQKLILIFRVNVGVTIDKWVVGETILKEIVPPQKTQAQRLRGQ